MNHFYKLWSLLLLMGCFAGGCSPNSNDRNNTSATTGPNQQSSASQVSSTPGDQGNPTPISSSSSSPVSPQQPITWKHYTNPDWFITLVTTPASLDYYACEHSRINCLALTNGVKTCPDQTCTYAWENGSYVYRLAVTADDRATLTVSQQDQIIRTAQGFIPSAPSQYTPEYDWIPDERQEFLRVSEQALGKVLIQIQQAAIEEKWEQLSALAADTVLVNFDQQGISQEVTPNQLPQLLANQDLSVWRIRLITQTMADLFFHHDGIMLGQGDIWLEQPEAQPPQIMTINLW